MFHCSVATENIAFRGAVTGLAGLMAGSTLMALAARPAQAQVVICTANATTAVTSVTAVTAAVRIHAPFLDTPTQPVNPLKPA